MTLDFHLDVALPCEQVLQRLRRSIDHSDIAHEDRSVLGTLSTLYFGRFDGGHFAAWRNPSSSGRYKSPALDGYLQERAGGTRILFKVSASLPPEAAIGLGVFLALPPTALSLITRTPALLLFPAASVTLGVAVRALLRWQQRREAACAKAFFAGLFADAPARS